MPNQDVVFLIPGFLGFERSGNFANFGDRVSSTLRTCIEQTLGRSVPVIAIADLPAQSFLRRQRALLRALAAGLAGVGGAARVHLVGYSVGGIDAYLLTCARPLGATDWALLGPDTWRVVRASIASMVGVAAPHHGTCLATAKGAGTFTPVAMLRDPEGALYVAQLLPKLLSSAWSGIDKRDAWYGVRRETRKIAHFTAELARFQALLPALAPLAMENLYRRSEPSPGIRRASVVTLAGVPAGREVDPFFAELAKRTAGPSGHREPALANARELVRAALGDPARLVASPGARLPLRIESGTSDGVVNTCRQLIDPFAADELLNVVVADHFDVIGYYDRFLQVGRERREVVSGLLRSGSHFRDDEFFALYRRVGEYIARAADARGEDRASLAAADAPSAATTQSWPAARRSRASARRSKTADEAST